MKNVLDFQKEKLSEKKKKTKNIFNGKRDAKQQPVVHDKAGMPDQIYCWSLQQQ